MIGGKQMTFFWHVDDLKVSHMETNVFTKFMDCLESIYEELRITRGEVHEYLGMTLDFRAPGLLWVTMVDYLKGVLEDFPEVIIGRSTIPEVNYLKLGMKMSIR